MQIHQLVQSPPLYGGVDYEATFYLDYDFFDNFTIAQTCSLDTIGVDVEDLIYEQECEYLEYHIKNLETYDSYNIQCLLNTWEMNAESFRYDLERMIAGLESDLFI